MGDKSKIEWTATRDADGNVVSQGATWNVVTGCARVSEGCRNCYAERLAATRLAHVPAYTGLAEMTPAGPRWTGEVRFNAERLDLPLRWQRPRVIFVNSQSDLFHEGLSNEDIAAVFGVMAACPQHVFQVLTKRPARMLEWFGWVGRLDAFATSNPLVVVASRAMARLGGRQQARFVGVKMRWPLPNVWLGVSCEDQATADERIPLLLQCPAAVRWVSAEPLLGPVDLMALRVGPTRRLDALHAYQEWRQPDESTWYNHQRSGPTLDWVVVGGESGPGARPMHPGWAEQIRDSCVAAEVPFFFKQWGEWAPGDAIEAYGWAPMGWYEENPEDGGKERRTWPDGMNHGQRCPGMDTMVYRVGKRDAGRLLDGRTWDEMPARVEA